MRFGNGGAWPANLAGSFAVLARRRQVREKELSSTCITVELKAIFTSSAAARIESHADKHHRPSTDLSVFSPFVGTRQLSYADCNSPSRRLQELHGEQILMPTILPNLLCCQSRSAIRCPTQPNQNPSRPDRAPPWPNRALTSGIELLLRTSRTPMERPSTRNVHGGMTEAVA
ncbi:unnamed protein product [Urochloa humidicola]